MPQGSLLGSMVFVRYINDCKTLNMKFADDTKISIKKRGKCHQSLGIVNVLIVASHINMGMNFVMGGILSKIVQTMDFGVTVLIHERFETMHIITVYEGSHVFDLI